MNEKELQKVIEATVIKTLTSMGVTMDDPIAVQKDMIHLRNLRQGCEATRNNIIKVLITTTVPVALWIIWQAIRSLIIRQS